MGFLKPSQLEQMGFASLGQNVLISEKASIYGASRIHIGDHVRIDDFCILSAGAAGIRLGSFIHIACFCSLIGQEKIEMEDYSGLSSRVAVYSSSDDYTGNAMTNPMVPAEFTKVDHRPVHIGRHCIIGAGAVVLPGVTLGEGAAVGALALVLKNCEPFGIYSGVPAKLIRSRERKLLELETQHRAQIHQASVSNPS
jgi:acetyltransferase-like isoleucine patch superfamily enzyme